MQQNIILSTFPLDDLRTTIRECINEALRTYQPPPPTPPDELLTERQAAELLKVSKVTLHTWRKSGRLKYHRYGTRIRYSRSELLAHAGNRERRKGL